MVFLYFVSAFVAADVCFDIDDRIDLINNIECRMNYKNPAQSCDEISAKANRCQIDRANAICQWEESTKQ